MASKKRSPAAISAESGPQRKSGIGQGLARSGAQAGTDSGVSDGGHLGDEFRDPYSIFAEVYDEFMEHVPYAAWAHYLDRRYRALTRRTPRSVVDLACGTGQLLAHFPPGLQRSGMDGSRAMLERARRRLPDARLYHGRLERSLKFADGSQPHLVSTHDSLNYLLDPEDLSRHFAEVRRVLAPDGIYSLDLVSLENILKNFDNQTLRHKVRGRGLVWKNEYDPKTRLMRSDLEFYDKGARKSDPPAHTERHLQRYYSIEEVRGLARRAGLEVVLIEGDYEPREHRPSDNFWNLHLRIETSGGRRAI
ncbi:MAG: methyltransferase domain-containing protein [bacterium]|nr:methyltransferase domain-containing protein [bacterium]